MHSARPSKPRIQPIEKVAEKARAAMKSSAANAVNVAATMHHNRTIAKAIGAMSQAVLFDGGLSRRNVEIAVLRMGWNCQAVYEFGQHTLFGREAGLAEEEIYLVTRPIAQGKWTAAEAAILQVVDDLYADDCVGDASWAAASEHFDTSEIIHLVAAACHYRTVSAFLNSAGVELDEGVPGWPTAP
ncbi:MAG: carboxymuconolactone decarboxylase family protein [Pseudomonadota bacterium]